MADLALPTVRVTDLPTANIVSGGDYAIIDQSDATRKASLDTIFTNMKVTKVVFFAQGGTLESKKDIAYYAGDNKYYTWNGTYPKTIAANSTPASTGGVNATGWQVFGSGGTNGGAVRNLGNVTTAMTVDLSLAETFTANLTNGQCVVTFTNPANNPNTSQVFTLVLSQGTGANIVAWPSNILWNYGREPVLSYKTGVRDVLQFVTYDNGNTWIGSLVMAGVE